MVKAGNYVYPIKELDDCVDLLKKANDLSKEISFTRDQFAEVVGLSAKGGNFANIISACNMYGLVDVGDGYIRYTDITKLILHGTNDEKTNARSRAVRNVPLFSELYDKYDGSPNDEQIRLHLRGKGNVDISEVNHHAKTVSKLFNKIALNIIPDAEKQNESSSGGDDKELNDQQSSDRWILQSPYGRHEIKDAASLKAAKAILTTLYDKYPEAKEDSSE